MISVQEATEIILSNLFKPGTQSLGIEQAIGLVLAEEIRADRDFPPFDRVTMDGIAIRHERFKSGQRKFSIECVQAAGERRKRLQNDASCVEVMTGAMLPENTDTVIRYEDVSIQAGVATIIADVVEHRQSIHPQGQDARENEILLSPGLILSPAEIAVLASVGRREIRVRQHPKTAIVSSGDELVDIDQRPLAHQIRRSNAYAIQAAIRKLGFESAQFHVVDDQVQMARQLEELLTTHDALILSGGVSKGKFDFIPSVLNKLGVKQLFHQVSQRPGKPFWFGVTADHKAVFAFPGNPVSTFMCFYRYFEPWLSKSLGVMTGEEAAILATDFSFSPRLTYFLQVSVKNEQGKLIATPDPGGGSGDFANLKKIDGFLELPLERSSFGAGESFPFFRFRR